MVLLIEHAVFHASLIARGVFRTDACKILPATMSGSECFGRALLAYFLLRTAGGACEGRWAFVAVDMEVLLSW